MAKKKRRRKSSLPKKRSPRAETRWKRIAEILERTRKGREQLDELVRGAERDRTPVTVACYRRSMQSLHDSTTSVEVGEDLYNRLVAAAVRGGKSPEALADVIIVRALEREQNAAFEAERARTAIVLCDCCRGRCKKVFVWRGVVRCGCVNNPIRMK